MNIYTLSVLFTLSEGLQENIRLRRDVDIDEPVYEDPSITSGSTYIRWGRTVCSEFSELIYRGYVGGTWFNSAGGASNYLCMTSEPLWGDYNDNMYGVSTIHGAEYEVNWPLHSDNIEGNHHNHDVPCAVCMTTGRQTNIMIPGRNDCLGQGWTLEYHGYIMSQNLLNQKRTEFVCMDVAPEADPAGYEDKNGALFYYSEAACGSLPCPPYVNGREITCAVCSK